METFGEVTFAVALREGEIVASSFGSDQKTVKGSILAKLPLNAPFQVCDAASPQAEAMLRNLKAQYDGKEPPAQLKLATAHMPCYTQKVLAATQAVPVGYVTTYDPAKVTWT